MQSYRTHLSFRITLLTPTNTISYTQYLQFINSCSAYFVLELDVVVVEMILLCFDFCASESSKNVIDVQS